MLNEYWEQTEEFIRNGNGGYIIEKNPTTYGEFPVQFNGHIDRKNEITVKSDAEVDIVEMFWLPHVHEKTNHLFDTWRLNKGLTVKDVNEKLSFYVLEFRNFYKDTLFGIAKRMLNENNPKPVKHTVVTVKVKPSVKMKPIHKNNAITGTVASTSIITALSYVYHVLPPDVSNILIGVIAVILALTEHTNMKKILEEIED